MRQLTAIVMTAILFHYSAMSGSSWQSRTDTEAKVRALAPKSPEIKVEKTDGTVISGRLVSVGENSFTVRQRNGGTELTIPFTDARRVSAKGMSLRAKAILITAIAVGGTLLFFCAAPYPIGFLCREDPS